MTAPQKQSDTPSKGVDAELENLAKTTDYADRWLYKSFRGLLFPEVGWTEPLSVDAEALVTEMVRMHTGYIKALLKAQLDGLLAELPSIRKHHEAWCNYAQTGCDCGVTAFNNAVSLSAKTIKKHREAL